MTSSFLTATAYAFRNGLKSVNDKYNFNINNMGEIPIMTLEIENIPDNFYGYVYVFENNQNIIKDKNKGSLQFRSYEECVPIDIIKVFYKDYEEYYERIETTKK